MIANNGGPGREDVGAGSDGGGGGGALKKGPWSAGEDAVLIDYVRKHGEGNWNAVQRNTGLQRCGKSCRLRWANHLRPNLKKGAFSSDEERLIIDLHSKLGNKWARISAHLPGRTDNEIKNYWNTRVKRRLRQGLPLYPDHLPIPPPPPQQPPTLSFSLHKTPPTTTTTTTLPLFSPVSLSSTLFSLHHPPPFLSSHLVTRPNTFLGRHVSTLSQLGPMGFSFNSGVTQIEPGNLGLGLDRCGSSSDFNGLNFELPSNQLYQNVTDDDDDPDEQQKINANLGRTNSNSGLLDDLLHEAQEKVRSGRLKRERDDCGDLKWDISSSENSSTRVKKEESEERQLNSMNEDLSDLLELIPSLVQVPAWCDDGGGRESSVGQSSVVSADDNCNGDQLPSFPADDDDDYWNRSCSTWDNLPRIC